MTLHEKLTQDAQKFLREQIDPRRDAENAKRFKTESAQVRESVAIIPIRKIAPEPKANEEMLFSPNSNAQGVE